MKFAINAKLIFISISIFTLTICSFVKGNSINSPFSPDIIGTPFSDTSVVNKYIELSFDSNSNNPFAIYYSFEALELAKKIKYQKGVDNLFRKCFTPINRDETFNSSRFSVLSSQISVLILYDSLGYYYSNSGEQAKALYCFRKAVSSFQFPVSSFQKSVLNGIAGCYKKIGVEYFNQSNYEISIEYSNKALQIYKRLENKLGIGSCYNNIGIAYINSGNNLLAIDNLLKSLKIFEDLKYKIGLAHCNLNIALVYTNEKDYSKALDYIRKAIRMFEKIKNKAGIFKCYNIWGNIYSNRGNYIKAIEFYNYALKISEELKDEVNMANILNNIGDSYMNLGDYSKALEYFNKSLVLNNRNREEIIKIFLYINIADTYLRMQRYSEAIEYALKSLKSSKELKVLFIENDGYRILTETYNLKGNYKKAKEYADLYKTTGDSLYNSNKSKQIIEIQTKYESAEKESRISGLEKEKQIQNLNFEKLKGKKKTQVIFFSIIIFCLFLIILLILGFYSRLKLRQRNIIERELAYQRELNYKEVIDAQENERKHIAEDLHDSLGQMLSSIKLHIESSVYSQEFDSAENKQVLKNTMGYIDDACSEVRNISHHLMPEALIRLGLIPAICDMIEIINKTKIVKINFINIFFGKRLNESTEINIYRMIQELLGNVIKHSQATQIEINMSRENNNVSLTISDNGKGFDTTKIEESKGIGLKNIYSRLAILNGKIDIVSEINKGTKISINFVV